MARHRTDTTLSRRRFLWASATALAVPSALLAACAPAAPPTPTPVPKPTEAPKPGEPTATPAPAKPTPEPTKPSAAAPTATPAPVPATKPGEPTPSTSRPGTLSFWNRTFPPHHEMMTIALDMFKKKYPKQEVDYQALPGDYGAKWRAAFAAAQAPDVLVMHGTAILELAVSKQAAPLTPDVMSLAEVKRDFMPENYLQGFYKGNVYALGVPDPPGDAGLVANLDHLQEAGLKHIPAF